MWATQPMRFFLRSCKNLDFICMSFFHIYIYVLTYNSLFDYHANVVVVVDFCLFANNIFSYIFEMLAKGTKTFDCVRGSYCNYLRAVRIIFWFE